MATTVLLWLLLLGALLMAFLLSGMESGVLALSRFRVRRQVRAGNRRAKLLHDYLENSENFLWTILVGNTAATLTAFSLIVVALHDHMKGRLGLFALAFATVVFLFYIFCDLLPKMLFQSYPNRLCLALAVPFRLLHATLFPIVSVLAWFSNAILRFTGPQRLKGGILSDRRAVRLALQETAQILTSEERAMVDRVLDLQDLTVRSITVPLHRAVGVTEQTLVRDLLEICRRQPVNRLPVWDREGPGRRTVGIVSLSALLFADNVDPMDPVRLHAKPPLQFREDVRLEEALRRMQRTRQRMAVVLGADRRELGIINLRDILKSIFGEVTL